MAGPFRLLLYLSVAFVVDITYGFKVEKYSLLMPNVRPTTPELYLCTPIKVDTEKSYYIVGFEPNATMETAHHMLLYGCTTPGSNDPVWDCGEMSKKVKGMDSSSPCGEGSQVIYAWARDAPPLELPQDVGFRVGKDSPIKYLVLQVHYATVDKFKDGTTDDSGIFLHYTERPQTKLAGVILLGTGGFIRPMTKEYMETACNINEMKTIHPFAYRTHTHSLGIVVSGYKVHRDENGNDRWTLLGKRDPLTPQMFYPVMNNVTVGYQETLAARCTMNSHRKSYTSIGPTNNDEMCNFYLMYWVEGTDPLDKKYCFSSGPPFYHWTDAQLNHIPDSDASNL